MTRFRIALIAFACLISVTVGIYTVSGFKLYSLARQSMNQVKAISAELNSPSLAPKELKTQLISLDQSISKIDAAIASPIWKPVVVITGQSERVANLRELLQQGQEFLSIAPSFLGLEGNRRYLLVFQNPAEARGTGGIIGAYAKLEVSKARVKVLSMGSNASLKHMNDSPVFISREFKKVYGSDPGIWQNSNMSPHFPYGARIWLGLWRNQFGENLDGVIAVDPFVLRQVLKVIGPIVMPDGTEITAENVVTQTLSTVYQRFQSANSQRKNYVVRIAQLTLEHLLAGGYSKIDLAKALASPARDGRVLVYSVHVDEENVIAGSVVGGFLSEKPNNEFRAVIENTAGNKMDYYLEREVTINSVSCAPIRRTRITVRLTNNISKNTKLPAYVMGRLDLGLPGGKQNSHGVTLFTYGPVGAKLLTARVIGGGESAGILGVERKRPLAITALDLRAGQTKTVSIVFEGGTGPIAYVEQPLVRPGVNKIINRCINSFDD